MHAEWPGCTAAAVLFGRFLTTGRAHCQLTIDLAQSIISLLSCPTKRNVEQAGRIATQCTVRAACWSDLHDTAAAAAAFCAHPAVRHVLAVRTAGLPEALAQGLAHCAERFGDGGSQAPALGGSLAIVGSEGDAGAAGVRVPGLTDADHPARRRACTDSYDIMCKCCLPVRLPPACAVEGRMHPRTLSQTPLPACN